MQHWHLITPEFPPDAGGVADYSYQVAAGLRNSGELVEVWCPGVRAGSDEAFVHRELGDVRLSDLRRVDRLLEAFTRPRRLLVEWVPHGWRWQSMNVAFCLWILRRRIAGDQIDLTIHEPFLSFGEGTWKQDLAALVHRGMITVLLAAAHRVFVTIPEWEKAIRPFLFGRKVEVKWLPVPNNIPVVESGCERFEPGREVLGHFGSYGKPIVHLLWDIMPALLEGRPGRRFHLLGRNSDKFRNEFVSRYPHLANQVEATGLLNAAALSYRLGQCEVMVQPYPDGVSSRRGTIMAPLAHGIPIVTNRGRLTESVWLEADAIELAAGPDPARVVAVTEALLSNAGKQRMLRERAAAFYRENFSLERVLEQLKETCRISMWRRTPQSIGDHV